MSKQDWVFHPQDTFYGNHAGSYRRTFPSSGLTTGERFVREVIQNSVDAHDGESGEGNIKIVFERRTLLGADKAAFVKALRLDGELSARREHYKKDKDAPPQLGEFFDHIHDDAVPLSLMIVSDFHTVGLGGAWDQDGQGDNFGRLVLGFGLGDKAESTESTGGSFGFGKTVYTAAAQSGLVAYYSVFQPTKSTGHAHARFMATGVLAAHKTDKKYSGFVLFGDPQADDQVGPFTDDVAHSVAKQCGLTVRSKAQKGTTILVIGAEIGFDEILNAAEIHWWPRILSHSLEVEVREGDRVETPRPRSNAALAPFIRCWNALMSGPEDEKITKERPINNFDQTYKELAGKKPGRLMLTAVSAEEAAEWETKESSDASPSRDRVVLIRSTRMVISYHRASEQSGLPPFAGVFLADDDVILNKVLTYSEPPAHNVWDSNSDRFKSHFPEIGSKVIKSIHGRIRAGAKGFQEALEPARPKNASASKTLGKILGRFLKSPGKSGAAPISKPKRNVMIHVSSNRVVESGAEYDVSKIELSLQPGVSYKQLNCRLSLASDLLGDDRLAVLEHRPISLISADGKVIEVGESPSTVVVLTSGKVTTFSARTAVGSRDVTRIKVTVDELVGDVSEEAA